MCFLIINTNANKKDMPELELQALLKMHTDVCVHIYHSKQCIAYATTWITCMVLYTNYVQIIKPLNSNEDVYYCMCA